MQKGDKKFLVGRIIEATNELHITAYECAKHIGMSEVGIAKILNGKVENPNKTSLKAIMHFLNGHHQINMDWLSSGSGLMKDVNVPTPQDFSTYSDSAKNKKLDEIAVFVAHHEEELMQNPIFKGMVERRGYQAVVKRLREEEG